MVVAELLEIGALTQLTQVVRRLGDGECPWTKEQSAWDLLYYMRKELIEVEEELRKHRRADAPAQDLVGELGDVLFDALLLIRVQGVDA